MTIEEEPEVALPATFAVPAVFLNRKIGLEAIRRVVIKAVVQGRIEKPLVMTEVVEVGHRQNPRAARTEDFQQQPVEVRELGFELVEQRVVVIAPGGNGLKRLRYIFQLTRDVKNDPLPAKFAFCHRLPIAREAFVTGALGPDVGKR